MKQNNSVLKKALPIAKPFKFSLSALCVYLLVFAGSAFAQSNDLAVTLPASKFLCDLVGALQSQWAGPILIIALIIEGMLFMYVKKGILQNLLYLIVAVTVIFGAAKILRMAGGSTSCASTIAMVEYTPSQMIQLS